MGEFVKIKKKKEKETSAQSTVASGKKGSFVQIGDTSAIGKMEGASFGPKTETKTETKKATIAKPGAQQKRSTNPMALSRETDTGTGGKKTWTGAELISDTRQKYGSYTTKKQMQGSAEQRCQDHRRPHQPGDRRRGPAAGRRISPLCRRSPGSGRRRPRRRSSRQVTRSSRWLAAWASGPWALPRRPPTSRRSSATSRPWRKRRVLTGRCSSWRSPPWARSRTPSPGSSPPTSTWAD